MGEIVKTFRVVRRQDMGGGRFREHDELIPEMHVNGQSGHYVHAGSIKEDEVDVAEFVDAVIRYCPQLAPQIAAAVGAIGQLQSDGSVRGAPMVPMRLPERANDQTVSTPPLERAILEAGIKQGMTTIRSSDHPQGAYAPAQASNQKEFEMVERSEGAKNVYEDASTVDPAALNEALTGTRPEDVAEHNADAAFEAPVLEPGTAVTGVAENAYADPIGSTPSGAVGDGSINPDPNDPARDEQGNLIDPGPDVRPNDQVGVDEDGNAIEGSSGDLVDTALGVRPRTTTDDVTTGDEGIDSGSDAELAAERGTGSDADPSVPDDADQDAEDRTHYEPGATE